MSTIKYYYGIVFGITRRFRKLTSRVAPPVQHHHCGKNRTCVIRSDKPVCCWRYCWTQRHQRQRPHTRWASAEASDNISVGGRILLLWHSYEKPRSTLPLSSKDDHRTGRPSGSCTSLRSAGNWTGHVLGACGVCLYICCVVGFCAREWKRITCECAMQLSRCVKGAR